MSPIPTTESVKLVATIDPTEPIVQETRRMTDRFRLFILQVENQGLIVGTGSPEGAVEAPQGGFYMNANGTAGAIMYIKRDADDGAGDKSKGWILV